MDILLNIVSTIAIAAFSSWIAVQLSISKFRTEKWWEKKTEAYERVIEAFHNVKNGFSAHMEVEFGEMKLSEDRKKELEKCSRNARDEILRASDIGAFILSKNALNILAKFEAQSKIAIKENGWFGFLDSSWSLADNHMKEFIEEAHRDLKQ